MTKGVYKRAGAENIKERLRQLLILQNLPYEKKIKLTENIIIKAGINKRNALLFSGGKDSTVLMDIMKKTKINFLVIYNNTGIACPKMVEQVRTLVKGENYIETQADDAFEMWERTGYFPILGKRSFTKYKKKYKDLRCSPVQCCYQLKEIHANKVLKDNNIELVFWGNRAEESNRRKLTFVDNGFIFKPKKYKWNQCYPIQHFTENDIYRYLSENINYNFDTGIEGGCVFCATDIHYYPNNLSKLYFKDYSKWKMAMEHGFAKQILIAKGMAHDEISVVAAINIGKILLKI